MSEREFSAHSGLSRGVVQKARKASQLVVYSDGSINATASDEQRADTTDPDQKCHSTGGDTGSSGSADCSSYLSARPALTLYQAQDKKLGIQKKKCTIVDRARADPARGRRVRRRQAAPQPQPVTPPTLSDVKGGKPPFTFPSEPLLVMQSHKANFSCHLAPSLRSRLSDHERARSDFGS